MHSSETERNSEECERDVEEMKMAEYMESHIDEEYEGLISGITSYGMFVELDNMIEGLIRDDSFEAIYEYDENIEVAKVNGPRINKVFKLGERIRVKVARASKEASEIDFTYVGDVDEKIKKKS